MNKDSNPTKKDQKREIGLPKEILSPNVKKDGVVKHLKDVYGLTTTHFKQLKGFDDINIHLKVAGEYTNPNIEAVSEGGYLVKVSNIHDSEQPAALYAQLSVMKYLTNQGIPCQEPIRSKDREELTDIQVTNKEGVVMTHKLSLRSFLPGDLLMNTPVSPKVLYATGAFVAKVTKALEGFYDPFFDDFDGLWSMNSVHIISQATFAVKDDKRRQICEEVLKAFVDEVNPIKHLFRKGMIHGDLNDRNILISKMDPESTSLPVTGLLDFTLNTNTHPVYDLAICAAYMMMLPSTNQIPRVMVPGYMLSGYSSLLSLNEAEEKVFPVLVAGRMVMSLVYRAYNHHLDSSMSHYIEAGTHRWDALESLWATPRDELMAKWKCQKL